MTHLAPVIPFTTDEAWRSRYGEGACVHVEVYAQIPETSIDTHRWEEIFKVRSFVNRMIEEDRANGRIGANSQSDIDIDVGQIIVSEKTRISEEDEELIRLVCGVSRVKISVKPYLKVAQRGQIDWNKVHPGQKCPRCWRYYPQEQITGRGVCLRCEDALSVQGAV